MYSLSLSLSLSSLSYRIKKRPFQRPPCSRSHSFPSKNSKNRATSMAMVESIVGLSLLVMLVFFLLLLFVFGCRPWRFFFHPSSSSSSSSSKRSNKADDEEKPLISNDLNLAPSHRNDSARSSALETRVQIEGGFSSPKTHGHFCKLRSVSTDVQGGQGDSLILDIISEPSEDLLLGQTLKRSPVSSWHVEDKKHARTEEPNYSSASVLDDDRYRVSLPDQRSSSLTLEVISGPSCGVSCVMQSTNTSRLPLTLGRVSPSDLLLKDSEVSGKHAMINWNLNKLRWELVDMGSLNGTLLNSQVLNQPDLGLRRWSEPIALSDGDIITLGTTSKVFVKITKHAENQNPFGVGVASEPMALRRGGRKLPMEDVCCYHWPLPGVEKFGLFGIFDGHGGANAAKTASKTLPKMVSDILFILERRERVLSLHDASEVLRDAFSQTEAAMNDHQYEGCTATVLLVWSDHHEDYFAQCANVGDSACVINIGEKQILMTEDHRITSQSERNRLRKTGPPLKDGETRLCGMNIARMLGDKFLKEQDARFTPEPYVSQVVHIPKGSKGFALMASDGLWDVISVKKATQLVLQTRERYGVNREDSAERIANFLLSEARTLRTKDNTSVILLDFDSIRTAPCNISPLNVI